MIFKVCVHTDRGEEGQPDTNRCGQGAGGAGQKSFMDGPLKLYFSLSKHMYLLHEIYDIHQCIFLHA